jgi:sterol desaturase/sphingolipid hydroxylase (fatty acid hydroxylase superfamily)
MIFTALIIVGSALFTSFVGYWTHRLFHNPICGPLYDAHMDHHTVQYPPGNLTSDVYRSSGKNNSAFIFTLAFSPIMLMVIASHFLLGISIWTCACVLASMIGTGLLHDYIHDGFHLNKSIWQRLPFFSRWQELHNIHHVDMSKNYGIFSFIFDKAFKTYKDK